MDVEDSPNKKKEQGRKDYTLYPGQDAGHGQAKSPSPQH